MNSVFISIKKGILCFFPIIILFSSCKQSTTEEATEKQVLRYWERDAIRTLDPLYTSTRSETWITAQLYNGLFALDENMELYPELVERFEVAKDSLSYRFWLKKGVYFHQSKAFKSDSSREMTAQDVIFTFGRLQKNKETKYLSDYFLQDTVLQRQADTALQVIDKYSFQIHLDTLTPHFLQLLTLPQTYIISKKAYQTFKKNYARHPVGTGAFLLNYEKRNHFLKLSKHPDYFKKDLPYLDEIEISWDYDHQTARSAFQYKSLDVVFSDFYSQSFDSPHGKINSFPLFGATYLCMSLDSVSSPFFEKRARKSLAYHTDYQGVVDSVLFYLGRKANEHFVPDLLPLFAEQNIKTSSYKIDTTFHFSLGVLEKDTAIAHFLKKRWAKNGMEAHIFLENDSTDAQIKHIRGNYADASLFLGQLDTGKSLLYDSLLFVAHYENDLTQRQVLHQKLEQLLDNEQLIIPLFYKNIKIQQQESVQDLHILPTGKLILEYTKNIKE